MKYAISLCGIFPQYQGFFVSYQKNWKVVLFYHKGVELLGNTISTWWIKILKENLGGKKTFWLGCSTLAKIIIVIIFVNIEITII